MAHTQILPLPMRLPADVKRDACLTRAAGYFVDREDLLEIACAATTGPLDLSRTEIEQLGAAVETLDTLVVQLDTERSADRRSMATLAQQLDVSNALGTKAHRELLAERDRSQRLALELETAVGELESTLDDLEAAQDKLKDATSMLASALAEALRMQAIAANMSRQLALRDHAEMERLAALEHTRAAACNDRRLTLTQRQRAQTVRIQRQAVVNAYHSQSMVFDVSDTDVVDDPVVGREQTIRIPEPLVDFGGAA